MGKIICFELSILFICSNIFVSCYSYHDLDNFVEYEKTDAVSFNNINLTLIYYKRNKLENESYLIIKKPSYEQENIIFQGRYSHFIDKMLVDKENQQLVYTIREIDVDSYDYQLVFFDLNAMKNIKSISVKDSIKKNKRADFIYDPTRTKISAQIEIDKIKKLFIFQILYSKGELFVDFIYNAGRDYIVFDIDTGLTEEIFLDEDKRISDYYQISKDSSTYVFQDNIKKLFVIFPSTKYNSKHYKRNYYGTYINDGLHNIRISKLYYIGGYNKFWLEDGQYVICGSYLFDTSGKLHELKIVDGNVLAVY